MKFHFFQKILYLVVPGLTLWSSIYFYNRISDGFNVRQIISYIPKEIGVQTISNAEDKIVAGILSQPFHYIGKGCQFYAFASDDGKYVLKILKQKHLRVLPWLKGIPFLKEKHARREERIKKLFQSCQIASKDLSKETGIIFCHLNKSPFFHQNLTLFDKMGFPNPIYLDDFEFVLQEKGQLLKELFPSIKDDPLAINERLDQLEQAILDRLAKGICDQDRSFVQNVAFSQDNKRAVFIDIGQFYKVSEVTALERKQDLLKRFNNLRHWSEKHVPELLPYVDEKIKNISTR